MTLDYRYPTPLPSTKGWGPGYPNCQPGNIRSHPLFVPGVHTEIWDLTNMLVAEMRGRGFDFVSPGCWGYGCRGTKNSSGNVGKTPSFHSWGLALDINAPLNPFGNDRQNTQLGKDNMLWVTGLMHDYGFFWLGPPIGDWMHYSFCGSPADAKAMTAKARKDGLGIMLTDAQKKTLDRAEAFLGAVQQATSAATFAGAGTRVGNATKSVEDGHTHGTGPAAPDQASGGPRDHTHGKTGKS